MYTDRIGAQPVRSLDGIQYFFIAYDYDTNYIFAKPISNLKDESIIAAFKSVFNEVKKKGNTPTCNVTDNKFTKTIKAFSPAGDMVGLQPSWQQEGPNVWLVS